MTVQRNVVGSWTGGKDGCLACYKALRAGYRVTQLLHSRDVTQQGAHSINSELLAAQAAALGIPLRQIELVSYERGFKAAVRELNAHGAAIEGAVFGHIGTHKRLVDRICRDLGIELLLPLWQCDPEALLREFIGAGFEAVVVGVRAGVLGKEWLGRALDAAFLHDFRHHHPELDPCGENGEYHTLVLNGPLFREWIRILKSAPILRNGNWFLEVRDFELKV